MFYSFFFISKWKYKVMFQKAVTWNYKWTGNDLSYFGCGCSQFFSTNAILLKNTHESALFGRCLESSVSQFGWCIDELQIDLFQCRTFSVDQQRFSQCNDAFLGSNATSLNHQEIVVHFSIEWEATHWSDWFVGLVVFSWGVIADDLQFTKRIISEKLALHKI